MKSAAVGFLVTILSVSSAFSQVHIRESATITPQLSKKTIEAVGNVNNHIIRFELDWSGADTGCVSVGWSFHVSPDDPCMGGKTVYSATSPLIYQPESPMAEHYYFDPAVLVGAGNCSVSYTLYCDNELIASWSGVVPGTGGNQKVLFRLQWVAGDAGTADFITPWGSYFGLRLPNPLFYGEGGEAYAAPGFDCTQSSWSPISDTLYLTILSGSRYASFHKLDYGSGTEVQVGTSAKTFGINNFWAINLVADGLPPDSLGDYVVIKGESNGLTRIDSVLVLPSPVVVTFDPPEIAPGDTANIIVKQRNPDGTITDFPGYQQFEAGVWSQGNCGTILSGSDTAQYLSCMSQPFNFIASDSVFTDSVGIRVGEVYCGPAPSVPGKEGNPGRNTKATPALIKTSNVTSGSKVSANKSATNMEGRKSVLNANEFSSDIFGIGYVKIKRTILLGETKYYYATTDPNNSNNLIINETTTEPPALGAGGLANATFDDPVAASGSEKNPVYWEKKWAKYSGTQFQKMEDLPKGMIRLVGRYWENGKTFKATLTAHTPDGKSGSIVIEVKKPARLGNLHSPVQDVLGRLLTWIP